mmetsp:Transcript_100584/g.290525  ORF Transcript_100584/g.290525 Transcript_100584/m.290525 type:complete len:301 (-) Transcript_100584:268-1170(-)
MSPTIFAMSRSRAPGVAKLTLSGFDTPSMLRLSRSSAGGAKSTSRAQPRAPNASCAAVLGLASSASLSSNRACAATAGRETPRPRSTTSSTTCMALVSLNRSRKRPLTARELRFSRPKATPAANSLGPAATRGCKVLKRSTPSTTNSTRRTETFKVEPATVSDRLNQRLFRKGARRRPVPFSAHPKARSNPEAPTTSMRSAARRNHPTLRQSTLPAQVPADRNGTSLCEAASVNTSSAEDCASSGSDCHGSRPGGNITSFKRRKASVSRGAARSRKALQAKASSAAPTRRRSNGRRRSSK